MFTVSVESSVRGDGTAVLFVRDLRSPLDLGTPWGFSDRLRSAGATMNTTVPWSIRGVSDDTREAVQEVGLVFDDENAHGRRVGASP